MIFISFIIEKLYNWFWIFKREDDFQGMYYLVELIAGSKDTVKYVPYGYRYDHTWKTPQGANTAAQTWSSRSGKKIQVRKLPGDPNWKRREIYRFEHGIYTALPGFWPNAPDTYPHFSNKKFDMIAYTETPEKGSYDLQTRIAPGKYLQKYFPDLGSNKIKELTLRLQAEVAKRNSCELRFAKTADEIEDVYRRGPHSCMSKPVSYYNGDQHPVRAYGDSDLSVAYIVQGGIEITARVLVWEEKKAVGRVYGEEKNRKILENLLEEQGYKDWDCNFKGAKLKAIPNGRGKGYCFPYIDHIDRAELVGDHIILGSGNICVQRDCGVVLGSDETCPYCDNELYEDEVYLFQNTGESVCCDCADSEGFFCEGSEEYYSNSIDSVEVVTRMHPYRTTRYWSQSYFDDHGFECPINERAWSNDFAVHMHNDEVWSQEAFEEYGFECSVTHKCYPIEEGIERLGVWFHKDHDPALKETEEA